MSTSRRQTLGRQNNLLGRSRSKVKKLLRRSFFAEKLEPRTLMAADVNPFYNYASHDDVNGDGAVTPADLLQIVNTLNSYGSGPVTSIESATKTNSATPAVGGTGTSAPAVGMLDVNNDGYVSPADALQVINALNTPAAGTPQAQFTLEADYLDGTQITSPIPVGTHFLVKSTALDLRPTGTVTDSNGSVNAVPTGLFAAYDGLSYANSNSTTITAASNNVALPASTINVGSTTGFPSAGTLLVTTGTNAQLVKYTGITATSFTGCTGGTGTMTTGGAVVGTNASVDTREDQLITVNGNPTGGTFTLSFGGQSTSLTYAPANVALGTPASPSAFQVQQALQSLSSIGAGNVEVQNGNKAGQWLVRFGGTFANTTPAAITTDASGLKGGTSPTVSVVLNVDYTTGAVNPNDLFQQSVTFYAPFATNPNAVDGNNPQAATGATLTPGVIEDVGAAGGQGQEPGAVDQLVWEVEMTATAPGTLTLQTIAPTVSPGHDDLFYHPTTKIDPSVISFGSLSLTVVQPVTAGNVNASALENSTTPTSINVLASDSLSSSDVTAGGVLRITGVQAPSANGGTVAINNNGTPSNFADDTISYTPKAGFVGTDTFTYTVGDGLGNTATATVSVLVNQQNQAPVITYGITSLTTKENTPIVFSQANGNVPTFSDSDSGGNNETVTLSTTNTGATLTLSSIAGLPANAVTGSGTNTLVVTAPLAAINTALQTATITYQPAANFFGTDTLTLDLNDLGNTGIPGALHATKTIPVTVTQVDQAPTITAPTTVAVNNTSTLTFNGSNLISIADVDAGTNETVTLSIPKGTLTAGATAGVTGNNSSSMTITGSLMTINAALNGLVYTPATNDNGTENLLISVNDNSTLPGGPQTATATVGIVVVGIRPFAPNETYVVNESIVASGTPTSLNVLSQAFANTGASPTLISFTTPASGGTVTLVAGPKGDHTDDTLSFVPNQYFSGPVTFTYTVNDTSGTGANSTGTVTVNVAPINQPPVANPDSVSTNEDVTLNLQPTQLTGNDSAGPGTENQTQTVTVTGVTNGANGTATLNGDGTITYVPKQYFHGTDTFTYTITDNGQSGFGANAKSDPKSAIGTVTVTVNQVNIAPHAIAQSTTANEDAVAQIPTSLLLTGDDVGAPDEAATQTISVTSVNSLPNGNGTVTLNGTNVTFTPTKDYFGPATFTYTITDTGNPALTATNTVTVTVLPVNQAPVVVTQNVSGIKNVASTYTQATLLAGDTPGPANESSQTISITAVSATSAHGGTVTLDPNTGNVTYTPASNYTGPDSFTYTVTDNGKSGADLHSDPKFTIATANVNVANFLPSSISGFVFEDSNHNGVKVATELGFGGVTVTLQGTDIQNTPVFLTTTTAVDGSYSFTNLAPGNYTVSTGSLLEVNPGTSSVGNGGTLVNGAFNFVIGPAGGLTSINNNFGEGTINAAFISLYNPLLSTNNNSQSGSGTGGNANADNLLFAVDANSNVQWYLQVGGPSLYTPTSFVPGSGLQSPASLTTTGSQTPLTLAATQYKYKQDGQGNGLATVSIPVAAPAVATPAVASNSQYAQSVDAVFGQMGN